MLYASDDDSYMEDESQRRDYLLSDVGVIWRGTSRHKVPLVWEFGQVSESAAKQSFSPLEGV